MNSIPKNKILTIGETLIRLNINNYLDEKINKISYFIGGDALNVASILGYNGNSTYYLSFVNKDSIWYRKLIEHLAINRVKSLFLLDSENRLGTYYYLPKTSFLEKSSVEYDRNFSAYSVGKLENNDVERIIITNFNWVHLSGISVAINKFLNKQLLKIVESVFNKEKNVSFDLNYRSKLWSNYSIFKNTIHPFLEKSNIAIGWISKNEYKSLDGRTFNMEKFKKEIEYTIKNYQNLKTIVSPVKSYDLEKKLSKVKTFAYHNGKYFETDYVYYEPKFPVGSGDAFTGMLIHCMNQEIDFSESIFLANKAYAYKNLQQGDNCSILKRHLEKDKNNNTDKIER